MENIAGMLDELERNISRIIHLNESLLSGTTPDHEVERTEKAISDMRQRNAEIKRKIIMAKGAAI